MKIFFNTIIKIYCLKCLKYYAWGILERITTFDKRLNLHYRVALFKMLKKAFVPTNEWGPREVQQCKNWRIFKEDRARIRKNRIQPIWKQIFYVLLNMEPK